MIPEPEKNGGIEWLMQHPEAPRDTVRAVNKLLAVRVTITQGGTSSLLVGDKEAVLTISTKDINLGSITGSKGSNAALSSLMSALKRVFTVNDSTT
jgi:hypothetical protein